MINIRLILSNKLPSKSTKGIQATRYPPEVQGKVKMPRMLHYSYFGRRLGVRTRLEQKNEKKRARLLHFFFVSLEASKSAHARARA